MYTALHPEFPLVILQYESDIHLLRETDQTYDFEIVVHTKNTDYALAIEQDVKAQMQAI
jgi:hypothetical protein